MLTLGNRDVGKVLGVNNFGGEREMEDMELEEGEAYSYHNNGNTNDDYGDCIDPDVSLSYIDAKIQNVLGHFQKDFEGGVSAENLGTKFGGYGSFLENGERSPICDTPRSPPSSHLEDGSRNPASSLSVPLTMRARSAPLGSSPSRKQFHVHGLVKQEGGLPPLRAVDYVNSNEREEAKSANLSDQRMLKVRIKVGSDNLSTQKKAAIYSGLGLDVSPSTSLDCSPSESEGMSHKRQDVLFGSPTSILQMMTSFLDHENLLCSPLPDGLIHFDLKEKLSEHRMDTSNPGPVSCRALANGSVPLRDQRKALDRKTSDPKDKNDDPTDLKSIYGRNSLTGASTSKRNMDTDTMDCEEVVSKTLKQPIISSSGRMVNMMKYASHETGINVLGDKTLNDDRKEQTAESPFGEDLGVFGKPKGYPGKPLQDKKVKSQDVLCPPKKNSIPMAETCNESEIHSVSVEGKNVKNAEGTYHAAIPSEITSKTVSSLELDNLALGSRKEKLPSKGKAKLKGSRNDETFGPDASRESLSGSSSATKSNKSVQLENSRSRSGRQDMILKDSGKSKDRYKEFFGDLDGEDENQDELMEVAPEDDLKDFVGAGKGLSSENLKRIKSSSKKIIKSLKPTMNASSGQSSELANKHDEDATPVAVAAPAFMKDEYGDKFDQNTASVAPTAPVAAAAPVFIEDWVCCDKCQKWRLLPPGKNPDDLPDKWLCSMLDWLPGKNKCSVSQEETTGAIMASLQVPFPDAHKSDNLNSSLVGANINAPHQSEVKHTYVGPPPPSSKGKKKTGTKRISFPSKDGPQFSDSEKKLGHSAKSRSLDHVKQIPLRNEVDYEQPIKRHDSSVEKSVHEAKEHENHSDGGDLRSSKPSKRRETDRDYPKTSKKVKNDVRQHDNKDWRSDDGKITMKVIESSTGGMPIVTAGKDHDLDEEAFTKMSKRNNAEKIQVSLKNLRGEGQVSLDGQSVGIGGSKERDFTAKKRKQKDPEGAQDCLEGPLTIGNQHQSSCLFARDSDYKKDKKPRILKSEPKDPGTRRGSSKTDKRGSDQKNHQLHDVGSRPSRWGIDEVDSLQKKMRSPMPTAAASSSSKVCSSPKSKSSFQEMKGSPAESVSSSPIRSSKHDKLNLLARNPVGKDESEYVKIDSPGKCPGGDVIAPTNHFRTGRQEESATAHYRSLASSLVPNPDENGTSASAKAKAILSVDAHNQKFRKDSRESSSRDALGLNKTEDSDQCLNGRQSGDSHHASESYSQKSGKGSSSRSRSQSRSSKHEAERDNPNKSVYMSQEAMSVKEARFKEGKADLQENLHEYGRGNYSADELGVKCGRVGQSDVNGQGSKDDELDSLYGQNEISHVDKNRKKSSTKPYSSKADQSADRGHSLPSSLPGLGESTMSCGTNKVNEGEPMALDTFEGDLPKLPGKLGEVDQSQTSRSWLQRHLTSNGNSTQDSAAKSPIRRDSSSQAANKAIQEGRDLKHLADRYETPGSNLERTGVYFQAALKFLHGASLLESCKSDSSKQSIQVYGSTGKLCEFCAREYEKSKDMASAALAYKCMEVAYMKVVNSSNNMASRDRLELQTAFKINPAGESPSSSASDLDHVNNSAAVEKSVPKGVCSPQVTGSQTINARNRTYLLRLLSFSQDVNNAMEASRKSRVAFSAASARTGDPQFVEGISCIRRALDFHFQDVQELLRLVRLANDAISR